MRGQHNDDDTDDHHADDANPAAARLPSHQHAGDAVVRRWGGLAQVYHQQGGDGKRDADACGRVVAALGRNADRTMVGLGVGIPQGALASCTLATSITTAASSTPQFNVPVDTGSYCVTVYDVGTLTDTITFDLTIVYP